MTFELPVAPENKDQAWWDNYFIKEAELISTASKDPSTKCGAVIVRPDKTIAAKGYNGFAKGMDDTPELYADREEKYSRIVHCEMNALISARERVDGYTLYTFPFLTCDRCAVHMIQAGITRVVAPRATEAQLERWGPAFEKTRRFYREAKIACHEVP